MQPFLLATSLYGRCLALTGTGELAKADEALELLKRAAHAVPLAKGIRGSNNYDYRNDVGKLLVWIASAGLYLARNDTPEAVRMLRSGVLLQDSFGYLEPTPFYVPLRHCLAAALVYMAQRESTGGNQSRESLLKEALELYHQDLKDNPKNFWSFRAIDIMSHWKSDDLNSKNGTLSCCEIGLC